MRPVVSGGDGPVWRVLERVDQRFEQHDHQQFPVAIPDDTQHIDKPSAIIQGGDKVTADGCCYPAE